MSNQRKLRSELRQGLHQFTMSLYRSYSQSMSHEDAVEQIAACLREEIEYYTKQAVQQEEESSIQFDTVINDLLQKARAATNATRQMELYQEIETLTSAQEIIQAYATREGN